MDEIEDDFQVKPNLVLKTLWLLVQTLLLLLAAAATVHCLSSFSWPQTTGYVTKTVVGNSSTHGYPVTVNYSFFARGDNHAGSALVGMPSQSDVEPLVKQYPEGRAIPVYFNPMLVSDAFIQRGQDWQGAVAAVVLFLLSLFPQLILPKRKGDESKKIDEALSVIHEHQDNPRTP